MRFGERLEEGPNRTDVQMKSVGIFREVRGKGGSPETPMMRLASSNKKVIQYFLEHSDRKLFLHFIIIQKCINRGLLAFYIICHAFPLPYYHGRPTKAFMD